MPSPAPESGLIFDWRKPRGQFGRLLLWIVVTVLALTVFFFLFRVVYPQTQRFIPVAQQIVVLNPSDPVSLASINHVKDRDFMVLPSFDQQKNAVNLDDRAPVFHPLYEKHELKLKDVSQRESVVPPVRLLDVTAPILPPLDLSELHRAKPSPGKSTATVPRLELQITGALGLRKLTFQPEFPAATITDPEAWRFEIGVNSDGRVIFALPTVNPEKNDESARMLGLLKQLRFAPDSSQSADTPVWGIATLNWAATPAAP